MDKQFRLSNELFSLNALQIVGEKVLGLKWLNVRDKLTFNTQSRKFSDDLYSGNKCPTKREFLSVIMAIFDPLGFLTSFTIGSRILMQKIWTLGIAWDEKIREDDLKEWKLWLLDLEKVKTCRVDHCYQLNNFRRTTQSFMFFVMQALN